MSSMATTNQQFAAAFQASLKLERVPVGLAFVDSQPAGVADASAGGPAPSACTFWRRAEQGVLYAAAEDHYQCPIGVMTMGFELPEAEKPAAMELVGTMVGLDYFSMDEVAHLPAVKKAPAPHTGIVYGPLAELPVAADVVLLVVSPYQGMLLAEAGGDLALGDSPALAAMGRPACSAVAWAFNEDHTTLSLGCIGARTYAEIPPDRAVAVVPGSQLAQTMARLETLVRANETLAQYHGDKRARLATSV